LLEVQLQRVINHWSDAVFSLRRSNDAVAMHNSQAR
jgi:hypothetical protein